MEKTVQNMESLMLEIKQKSNENEAISSSISSLLQPTNKRRRQTTLNSVYNTSSPSTTASSINDNTIVTIPVETSGITTIGQFFSNGIMIVYIILILKTVVRRPEN
jgi:hypothetical protein